LTVNFNLQGSATPGSDYTVPPSPVTVPAGAAFVDVPLTVVDDPVLEGNETAILALASGPNYAVASPSNAMVTIFDDDNKAPTVSITHPVDGLVFTAPAVVAIGTLAADPDGTVVRVEFYSQGTHKLGEVTSAPYTFVWTNAPAGEYELIAVVTDDLGSTAVSAPVTLLVNAPPLVTLVEPLNNATFASNATVSLTAQASDADGEVMQVEFFVGSNLLEVVALAPYSITWSNVPVGDYTLLARATDDRGAVSLSPPVNISVEVPGGSFADLFAERGVLTGFTNTLTGTNTSYTKEPGEPRHYNRNGAHSAWVSWIAPASGPCTVDTIGSSFDTVLAVYVNTPPSVQTVSNVSVIASDDDGGGLLVSRTTFTAAEGVAYQIAVDGFGSADAGIIQFQLSLPNPKPTLTTQPQSQTVNEGASATLTVAASGPGSLTYSWRLNGVPVFGGTSASLTLNNVQPSHQGAYTVVVSNSSGSVTSAPAVLTVRLPPSIDGQPQAVVVDPGGEASFAVAVNGTAPLSYQWRFLPAGQAGNGANLPGATSGALTVADVQYLDGGSYSVVVANGAGSASSQGAALRVRPTVVDTQVQTNGAFRLVIQATPGQGYFVEGSTNLLNWTVLGAATNSVVESQFLDTTTLGLNQRFYRVRLAP
jgi:hypothetical protein